MIDSLVGIDCIQTSVWGPRNMWAECFVKTPIQSALHNWPTEIRGWVRDDMMCAVVAEVGSVGNCSKEAWVETRVDPSGCETLVCGVENVDEFMADGMKWEEHPVSNKAYRELRDWGWPFVEVK